MWFTLSRVIEISLFSLAISILLFSPRSHSPWNPPREISIPVRMKSINSSDNSGGGGEVESRLHFLLRLDAQNVDAHSRQFVVI